MSQHDFDIANQTASNARADINSALQALASTSSGATEPATKYANQLWYDTTNNILKIRNEANSAWLNVGYVDQTNGFRVLDDTQVVNTSGTQTGLLGDQAQATWEAGVGTTESLVSPAKIKAAIDALGSFASTFTSSELTVSAAGGGAVAHGLGSVPTLIKPYWVCKTAEYGYSVGQYVDASNIISTWTSGTPYSVGFTVAADGTNISYRYGTTFPIGLLNLSTGANTFGTNANWRLVIRAWA